MVELGTGLIPQAAGAPFAGVTLPVLLGAAALGLYALLSDRTENNDDDDSTPGGGLMQPVA
ncbi:MAG: hypothetical protein VKJ05_04225 [Synechococcaceae cyanobacterium]|nr:hypothetical protein [Synechococcaceae cyanobacterium]